MEALLESADAAMYETKRQRAGGIAFHSVVAPDGAREAAALPLGGSGKPERRHALLRGFNEKLVQAALAAQQSQAHAEQARQRQAATTAEVADELRMLLPPLRVAMAMSALSDGSATWLDRQMANLARLLGRIDASAISGSGETGNPDAAGKAAS